MTPRRPMSVAMAALLLCLGLVPGASAARRPKLPKVEAPVEYCDEQEFGTRGEAEDPGIFPLERTGLRFDPMSPPDYATELDDSDMVPFHVTVVNGTDEPSDAILEINICAAEEECISAGADLWETPPYMRLLPGERRSLVVWTPDPVTLGSHRVAISLLDGDNNGADFFFGPFLRVGKAEVRIGAVSADGQAVKARGATQVRMNDPQKGVELSVDVSNQGFAPTALYAVFSIYVNRTCMDEVYAPTKFTEATRTKDFVVEPRRVEGGEEGVAIKGLWRRSNIAGDHIMTVQVFDETGEKLHEQRGIRMVVR